MIRAKIIFSLGKNIKEIIKIGSCIEDCFWKIERDYRKAAKPPVLVKFEILETYDIKGWTEEDLVEIKKYQDNMDAIREGIKYYQNGFEI